MSTGKCNRGLKGRQSSLAHVESLLRKLFWPSDSRSVSSLTQAEWHAVEAAASGHILYLCRWDPNSRERAEDISTGCLAKLADQQGRKSPPDQAIYPLVAHSLKLAAYEAHRRGLRHRCASLDFDPPSSRWSPRSVKRQQELVDRIIELPAHLREAIDLKYHQGLSGRDAAAAQGITRQAAFNRIHRAKAILRGQGTIAD